MWLWARPRNLSSPSGARGPPRWEEPWGGAHAEGAEVRGGVCAGRRGLRRHGWRFARRLAFLSHRLPVSLCHRPPRAASVGLQQCGHTLCSSLSATPCGRQVKRGRWQGHFRGRAGRALQLQRASERLTSLATCPQGRLAPGGHPHVVTKVSRVPLGR